MTSQEKTITAYCGAFVDELARSGVRHVVISPGSRSTPLAMLMAAHREIRIWMHVDERSAAFFALGMAKARRQPVAVLSTSGTAAVNYFPAVAEAHHARAPLIVCTADRPHEMRDVGAPQAIDQIHLYGSYVKWFVEMALPEDSPSMLQYVRTVAGRAAATTLMAPSGPVHLNFPFREPFIPQLEETEVHVAAREGQRKYVQVTQSPRQPQSDDIKRLAAELRDIKRGLIVCGPQDDPAFPESVIRLAERLQFPILADPLSQVRCGSHEKRLVIDGYDAFLRSETVVKRYVPDAIIRFGASPVSKSFFLYLQKHPSVRQIVIDGGDGWREPTLLASDMIYADPVLFCDALCDALPESKESSLGLPPWTTKWLELNHLTQEVVRQQGDVRELFEGKVLAELADLLPDKAVLFVGNSMPVRDLDTFFMNNGKAVRTMANRGANGIDGVISSALGASTTGTPLVLVIGDLSFFHDLNGLLAAKLYRLKATIIVLNNDGGGIFSFLPQAEHPEHFETLFGTPIGLDYRHAVHMYGGSYSRVSDWEQFRTAVSKGMATDGLAVIEVPTERKRNAEVHRAVWQAVMETIDVHEKEVN